MRTLVVETDRATMVMLCTLLEEDGFHPVAFEHAGEALEALQYDTFDAVVTDVELCGMHGSQIIRAARAARADVPVVVIGSGGEDPATLEAGASAVVAKPLSHERLVGALRRCGANPASRDAE